MNTYKLFDLRNLLPVCLAIFAVCGTLRAQTTTFTYQGRLTDSTPSGNGSYLMKFELYADAAGNTLIDTFNDVPVTVSNNAFTVLLNFNASNAFDGGDRYIKISVKRDAGESYTSLNPLQPITSTPYSIKSKNAAVADTANNALALGGTSASSIIKEGDARLTDARTPSAGSTDYVQNRTTQQNSASFNISGTGTANIFNAATQLNIGGNRVLSGAGTSNLFVGVNTGTVNTATSNLFVGTNAGSNNTTGSNNSFVGSGAGFNNMTGGNNSFFGSGSGVLNTGGLGNSFFGSSSGLNNVFGTNNSFVGTGAGFNNSTGSSNSFFGQGAGATNMTGDSNTLIGAGTNVLASNLTFATAVGADATVSTSNTVVLGRTTDTVIAPNLLRVNTLGAAGSTALCRNAANQISNCSSSLRYKTNVASFQPGLNLIDRLRPITFNWKDDGIPDLGFGAEDVAKVEPLLVVRNDKGEVEGVKYDRISAVLVNAVKEQQTQIKEQQTQIKNHQETIGRQQSQIDALKKLVCANNQSADVCREEQK